MTWRTLAACRDHPEPEIFYPVGYKSRLDRIIEAEAKAICAGCPVAQQCLADADDWGIWAGRNENERNITKRRKGTPPRQVAPHGTTARAKMHRRDGEKLCWQCREAERTYNNGRDRSVEYARRGSIAPALGKRRIS